jgi:16S rRNA processing protein RimM
MIVLGRIVAPFGIQGWVKIHPFGDDPASWRKLPHWWLSRDADAPDAQWKQYTLTACRPHGKGLVAALAEVPDRNAAEAIDGFFIAAPRDALPQPEENEYYWGDLVGLEVINEAAERSARSAACCRPARTTCCRCRTVKARAQSNG